MVQPTNLNPPTSSPMTGASVATRHMDYLENEAAWARIESVLAGSDGVKKDATRFLPQSDYDKRHPDQYWAYVNRANFVNYTLRTVSALEGLIFRKDPTVKVPSQYDKRLKNINNQGDDFISFSKKITNKVIRHGRVGILVDYIGGERNLDDPLHDYPFLALYSAQSIVNWRLRNINGTLTLDQVVLMEHYDAFREFGSIQKVRFKVLDLDSGTYRARTFEQRDSGEYVLSETIYPGKASTSGVGMRKIPFVFINPVDTSPNVHRSPILDLVDLNISHFRTSADYENALHVLSVPLAVITGLPEDSTTPIRLDGPTVLRLPADCSASYLEMTADGIAGTERALAAKEEQMREIGAQMLSSASDGPETAAAARIRQHSQTSVLSSIAGSVSIGLQAALSLACGWDGIDGDCEVELNQDYMDSTMPPQMLAELTRTVDSGHMTQRDYIWNLLRGELLEPGRSVEEVIAEMEKQRPVLRVGSPDPLLAAQLAAASVKPRGRNGKAVPVTEGDKPEPPTRAAR
jgi:hypothetical protein